MPTKLLQYILVLCLFGLLFAFPACQQSSPKPELLERFEILHLAHSRINKDTAFHKSAINIDLKPYELKLLGGDLSAYTSKDRLTMDSLNKVYDFGDPNTLWSLGNHDYDDLELIQEYTKRPPFYTYNTQNITFLVLDTQDSSSNFVGAQMEMIKNVIDTISQSTHLILLHHKLIWLYQNADLNNYMESISNGKMGELFHFINPNNFYTEVYPLLLEVEKKGIDVFCIAGDIGTYTKSFYYQTPEGVDFLASGLNGEDPDNKVLILKYDRKETKLDFDFVLLKDL